VQDAVNDHRQKLATFSKILLEISENPTVIEDSEFESKLRALNEKVNIVLEDAKSGAGGSDKSLTQKMEELKDQLFDIDENLQKVSSVHDDTKNNVVFASDSLAGAQHAIQLASDELNVSD